MPLLEKILNRSAKVGIMGLGYVGLPLAVTYKKNITDIRESPALDIIRQLPQDGAQVSYSDPFAPELRMDGSVLKSLKLNSKSPRPFDCVVIVTDHDAFDYDLIVRESALVVDCSNAVRKPAPNLVKLRSQGR